MSGKPLAEGLPARQRPWALFAVMLPIIMSVLDTQIANVALPTLSRQLEITPATSIWIVNSYQLALVAALLPMSSLGDVIGHRRVFNWGIVVFTLASLACALSTTLPVLAASRIVQGLGAGAVMGVDLVLIRYIFPPERLGRGVALLGLSIACAAASGPSVASAVLELAPWTWLFAVNVPIGLIAVALGWRFLPVIPGSGQKFDLPSAITSALTFGLLITGLDGIAHHENPLIVAGEFAVALVSGILMVRRQNALETPVFAVDLFRRPVFALSILTGLCAYTTQGLAYISLPFYFQELLGRSQAETGLLITPWPLAIVIVAQISGRLSDRLPAGLMGGFGLATVATGLALLAFLPDDPSTANILWRMAICGAGFSLFQTPNARSILSSVPKERSGNATGINATSRTLGQATGAALTALIFGFFAEAGGGLGLAPVTAILLGVCVAASGSLVSFLRLIPKNPATDRQKLPG